MENVTDILVKKSILGDLPNEMMNHHELVYENVNHLLKDRAHEKFYVFALNSKLKVLAYRELSRGSVNASVTSVRDVFQFLLLSNASNFIVAHNHPSGDTTPSQNDIDLTHHLFAAGKLMRINMRDHLIVGDDIYSFKDNSRLSHTPKKDAL